MKRARQPWMVLLCLCSLAVWPGLTACDEGGGGGDDDNDNDNDDNDDGASDADSDADSDSDADADADSDSDADGDLCENYPTANNNFAVNSVIRNYGLWDKTDAAHQLCEYGGGQEQLLFLAITATS
ncbi:MAG TPA: hypothetical protein VM285_00065 [Polyangia bacterium]|nr:hypothetical protein [Polyangia bacterium]